MGEYGILSVEMSLLQDTEWIMRILRASDVDYVPGMKDLSRGYGLVPLREVEGTVFKEHEARILLWLRCCFLIFPEGKKVTKESIKRFFDHSPFSYGKQHVAAALTLLSIQGDEVDLIELLQEEHVQKKVDSMFSMRPHAVQRAIETLFHLIRTEGYASFEVREEDVKFLGSRLIELKETIEDLKKMKILH